MKKVFLDLLSSSLLGLGLVFLVSPLLPWWWIHGDYERYVWIISGPYPYDSFGSGPFQLVMYLGLSLIGILLAVVALAIRVALRRMG